MPSSGRLRAERRNRPARPRIAGLRPPGTESVFCVLLFLFLRLGLLARRAFRRLGLRRGRSRGRSRRCGLWLHPLSPYLRRWRRGDRFAVAPRWRAAARRERAGRHAILTAAFGRGRGLGPGSRALRAHFQRPPRKPRRCAGSGSLRWGGWRGRGARLFGRRRAWRTRRRHPAAFSEKGVRRLQPAAVKAPSWDPRVPTTGGCAGRMGCLCWAPAGPDRVTPTRRLLGRSLDRGGRWPPGGWGAA